MKVPRGDRNDWVSWVFVGVLACLSVILAIVQYRWIGEVSRAESDRLHAGLETSLNRLSQEFNVEVNAAAAGLLPDRSMRDLAERRQEYVARYTLWRDSSRHSSLFRSVSVAVRGDDGVLLLRIRPEGALESIEWPAAWSRIREAFDERLAGGARAGRPGPVTDDFPDLFEVPVFVRLPGQGLRPEVREVEWLILELDLDYVRTTVIPDLMRRYLGHGGILDYEATISAADQPSTVIFNNASAGTFDASVRLFDPRVDLILRRAGYVRNPGRTGPGGHARDEATDSGRWLMSVRHVSGSLEAVVERGRWRNILMMTTIIGLLMASVAALVRYTRRAQHLADLQMQFVAGVSHELRTPLTVMRTAGHNLQGKMSADSSRVQRYGALIEEESGKLTTIVEQVLRFANVNAGRVIGSREPVSVAQIIAEALEADKRILQESNCVVKTDIAPDLPLILGDRNTLRHALQNLISNAAKYGRDGESIRISAGMGDKHGERAVEVRIEDRGPGIPSAELKHIFQPFYRGRKAVEDQIHGTGLGLCLAKKIIEAHHGEIGVASEEGRGARFFVRLPVASEA
jgi:signal transduction histidine kinase